MANEEHLAILRHGAVEWNAWRMANPDVQPDLREAYFLGFNLTGRNLAGVDFTEATLYASILTGTDLTGAWLRGADLHTAELQGANLRAANLEGADLEGADLTGANLRGTMLAEADLSGTILKEADLAWATLGRACFRGGNLQGATMTEARVAQTVFADVDLRGVKGLNTVQHAAPSHLSIDTLYRSQGDIPEIFLRGCGVPDSMIEYARSLVAAERPIDYYSCFISYSSHDEAVAQRLHADLQAAGVRCWFAPHNLEIGAVITRGIDEAIRIYDKLLIILSEASVKSNWVEFEVSQALHREIEQGRTMLFPIRLDDTVLHTRSGWAGQLRTRHVGDFRGWKDHDAYQTAFTRLLRDLKAKEEGGK